MTNRNSSTALHLPPGPAEPVWRPQQQFSARQLSPDVRRWLLDDGSLTERLTAQGRGPFRVIRLKQGWQVPLPSERALLDLPQRQVAIIREVILQQGQHDVVFARSVVPIASLRGRLAHLRRLENKPLGAILFGAAGMQRSPFELARISTDSSYLPDALQGRQTTAWGRRSRFEVYGHCVMVSEVFLDDFEPWPALIPLHRSRRGKVATAIAGTKQ
ncbi:chorismate--pyruvate lyase family protein [Pseudohalioglobus lutimaris]|uniref:Probable chorismate pyruvate-lyase n=1 Tax=Pseudohalioglobus lutimaris TaxID=1737061 RepID=A0A2N5X8W6_9GAMM|nr:chorismate lyase [Pseudohalioglobus lutimaris]PLW70937.1 chorismate lyase [Pseudohalioglobus lutimaris]